MQGCVYIIYEMFKRIVLQSDAKMAKHMQTKHTPKDIAERSAAASFPLGWWNRSFMFMLFWEIYKYRKEKKNPHHQPAVDELY